MSFLLLFSVVLSCVRGRAVSLLQPSQCVIIGFLVAELSPFPSGSVAVKLRAHYSNDHTHIYTATATISPPSTPTSGTHPHSPSPPPGPKRRQNKREGERERNQEEKALKWLSIAVSLLAVSPRRVTFAERE